MSRAGLWQRLAHLRPSLPRHIDIQARHYGDELWYILQDKSNGRFHRLSPSAYRLINLMNGRNNLQQIFAAISVGQEHVPEGDSTTREELIELIQYLHVADLLICDIPPNTRELFARQQQKNRQRWTGFLLNPITWKFPLGNPNRLLTALLPLARLLASPAMGLVWLTVVGYAVLQAGAHWTELTATSLDSLLSPGNVFLLWLTYPLLKVLHELGHGLFTKVWGGDVHEAGVVFVLATPLPYVDATAATGFAQKSRRLMVSAAGMAVEIFLAAVALLIWLNIGEGLLRTILYNIMIIGGVSTLFFNGNPLLRFDGYHLLCDALDTPNLATRANQQITYLLQRHGYGVQGLHSHAASPRESVGLATYALAAFVYRLGILVVIILLATQHFPTLGLVLAAWLVVFQLLLPLGKQLLFVFTSRKLADSRRRSITLTLATIALLTLLFFYLPLPSATSAEGLVWLPDDAHFRAQSDGEVSEILAEEGALVSAGQSLIQLDNPPLIAQLHFKQAVLKELQARYQQAWTLDRVQAQFYAEDIKAIEAEIKHLQLGVDNLRVRASSSGYFALLDRGPLIGRYLQRGDTIGLVVNDEPPRIRVALTQEEIGLVRRATESVEVRLAGDIGHLMSGHISQQVPAATFTLPSAILGAAGGGRLAVDKTEGGGSKSLQMIFLLDVSLPDLPKGVRYGERAYLLFRHPAEPLASRVNRIIRQLLIRNRQT